MKIFRPVNSLVVSKNLIVFKYSQTSKKKFRFPNLCLLFYLFQWLQSFWQICDFSQNKSCETYLGPMLQPGGRNWQLIYSNSKPVSHLPNDTSSPISKEFNDLIQSSLPVNIQLVSLWQASQKDIEYTMEFNNTRHYNENNRNISNFIKNKHPSDVPF